LRARRGEELLRPGLDFAGVNVEALRDAFPAEILEPVELRDARVSEAAEAPYC